MPEPVHHELEPQEERQPGQHERGRPEVAPQPPVEQAGGDEAPGQTGIVESLHSRQPRTVLTRRGIGGRVGVGTGGPGTDQDGALSGSGHAMQVGARGERDAEPLQFPGEVIGLLGRVDDHDHLGVGAGREGGEGGRQVLVRPQGLRCAGRPWAAAADQLAAEDDDARPLPFGQLLGDVPAGGEGAGGGSRGQQEVTQHHHPATEGDVEPPHRVGPGGPAVFRQLIGVGGHAAPIVSPIKGRTRPSRGGFGSGGQRSPAR